MTHREQGMRERAIGVCPECRAEFDLGARVGAKVGGAAIGALVAGGARHSLGDALVGAIIGALVGHVIDQRVLPTCPQCRIALEIVDAVL